uniref:Putative secreted protein n=1 Tax=Ixodes ricinus TaxID=34613 RepID=A0A6B0TSS7_IXORI
MVLLSLACWLAERAGPSILMGTERRCRCDKIQSPALQTQTCTTCRRDASLPRCWEEGASQSRHIGMD